MNWTIGLEVGPTVLIRVCGWEFLDGSRCGDLPTVRTAGGLYLCADHLTDWARGVYRPSWVDLATGVVSGGVTHGQTVSETSK
jgi:hypothetical protein